MNIPLLLGTFFAGSAGAIAKRFLITATGISSSHTVSCNAIQSLVDTVLDRGYLYIVHEFTVSSCMNKINP